MSSLPQERANAALGSSKPLLGGPRPCGKSPVVQVTLAGLWHSELDPQQDIAEEPDMNCFGQSIQALCLVW